MHGALWMTELSSSDLTQMALFRK